MLNPIKILTFLAVLLMLINSASAQTESKTEDSSAGVYAGAKIAKHPIWFKESFLDFSEDIDEAAEQGKRLALYFWQPGCPYCNQLWEHNMAVEGIEQAFQSKFDVVAINMWGDQEVISVAGKDFTEKQLARALDVDFTPTLQFYDENKKSVLRLNGYLPPKRFKLALQYASENHLAGQSFNDYVLSQQDKSAELARTEHFFQSAEHGLQDRSKVNVSRPLAVFFETPDCESCERFHDITLKHPKTLYEFEKLDVVQLNALSDETIIKPNGEQTTAKQWAEQLGINYYPSIAYFDEKGQRVMLQNAYFRNFHTQSITTYVLEKAYLQEPSFQRYISARADHFVEQGIDIDIWQE